MNELFSKGRVAQGRMGRHLTPPAAATERPVAAALRCFKALGTSSSPAGIHGGFAPGPGDAAADQAALREQEAADLVVGASSRQHQRAVAVLSSRLDVAPVLHQDLPCSAKETLSAPSELPGDHLRPLRWPEWLKGGASRLRHTVHRDERRVFAPAPCLQLAFRSLQQGLTGARAVAPRSLTELHLSLKTL